MLNRLSKLKENNFNVAYLPNTTVTYDLCSDVYNKKEVIKKSLSEDINNAWNLIDSKLGIKYILPFHNGRIAEFLCLSLLNNKDSVFANDIYLTMERKLQDRCIQYQTSTESQEFFSGNIHIRDLQSFISSEGMPKFIWITAPTTNGNPISFENIKRIRNIIRKSPDTVKLCIDGTRLWENSLLIKANDQNYSSLSLNEISKKFLQYFDIVLISCRKNLNCSMGGLLLFEQEKDFLQCKEMYSLLIGHENDFLNLFSEQLNFLNIEESTYKKFELIKKLKTKLQEKEIPYIDSGLSKITLDAKRFFEKSPKCSNKAQTLLCLLYLIGGIKAIGTFTQKGIDVNEKVYLSFHSNTLTEAVVVYLYNVIERVFTFCNERKVIGLQETGTKTSIPFYSSFKVRDEFLLDNNVTIDFQIDSKLGYYVQHNSTFGNMEGRNFSNTIKSNLGLQNNFTVIPLPPQNVPLFFLIYVLINNNYRNLKIDGSISYKKSLEMIRDYIIANLPEKSIAQSIIHLASINSQISEGIIFLNDQDIKSNSFKMNDNEKLIFVYCAYVGNNKLLPCSFLCISENHILFSNIVNEILFLVGSHEDGGLSAGFLSHINRLLSNIFP